MASEQEIELIVGILSDQFGEGDDTTQQGYVSAARAVLHQVAPTGVVQLREWAEKQATTLRYHARPGQDDLGRARVLDAVVREIDRLSAQASATPEPAPAHGGRVLKGCDVCAMPGGVPCGQSSPDGRGPWIHAAHGPPPVQPEGPEGADQDVMHALDVLAAAGWTEQNVTDGFAVLGPGASLPAPCGNCGRPRWECSCQRDGEDRAPVPPATPEGGGWLRIGRQHAPEGVGRWFVVVDPDEELTGVEFSWAKIQSPAPEGGGRSGEDMRCPRPVQCGDGVDLRECPCRLYAATENAAAEQSRPAPQGEREGDDVLVHEAVALLARAKRRYPQWGPCDVLEAMRLALASSGEREAGERVLSPEMRAYCETAAALADGPGSGDEYYRLLKEHHLAHRAFAETVWHHPDAALARWVLGLPVVEEQAGDGEEG